MKGAELEDPMRPWRRLVENRIQDAMAEGQFENLPGAGKPLRLDDDAWAGDWALANRMLVANGLAPEWVEERRRLADASRVIVERYRRDGDVEVLRQAVAEHNRRVLAHNLRSPLRRSPVGQLSWRAISGQKT